MKKRNGLVMMLCALLMSGTMFACASDSGDDNKEDENQGNGEQTAKMQATPASLSIEGNKSADFSVSYTIDGDKAQGGTLFAQSGNTKCFTIDEDTKEQVTIKGQDTVFTVVAKDVTEACNGMVNIIDKNNLADAVQVSVSVTPAENGGGGGTVAKDPEFNLVEPGSGQISLEKADDTAKIIVEYLNAKGKPQAGTYIEIDNSKDTCATPNYSDIETGNDGKAEVTVKAKGSNCTTVVTLTVEGMEPIEVAVKVGEADEYYLKSLQINYLNADSNDVSYMGMRHNDVKKLVYGRGEGETCPSDEDILAGNARVRKTATATDFRLENPFFIKRNYELSRNEGSISLIAIAYDSNDKVLAGGCVAGVDPSKEGQEVILNIHEAPIFFPAEYDVIANFDLLSSFDKTQDNYKAETMKAGDWVQFVVDFCGKPFETLVAFVWDNTVSRLADIPAIANISFIKNLLTDANTRDLATSALKDALKPTLESMTWYNIINQIAPDIKDLSSNLQLRGTFESGTYANYEMTGMKISFDQLQYQWSYAGIGQNGCIDGAYGNSKCRRRMPLGDKKIETIAGTASPTIELSKTSGVDGYMSFAVDNLTFKWATMLYNAIFGEILPLALGYSTSSDLTRGLYIKAFLDTVLFTPVADYYNENKKGTPTGKTDDKGNAVTYPPLRNDALSNCEPFVEALVYLIYPQVGNYADTVRTAATFACSDLAIGKLDVDGEGPGLIPKAFTNIEASTSQGLVMKTADCPLYSTFNTHANQYEYTYIGKPDAGSSVPAASDVFGTKAAATNRCKMDVSMGESFSFEGIFHAVDIDKED